MTSALRVASAALLLVTGCGGAVRSAARPHAAARAHAAARGATPEPPRDPEEALIGMLERAPPEISREATSGSQRTQVVPVPLRIADLPVLRGDAPMLDPKLAPTSLRDVTAPADLVLRPPAQRSYDWEAGFKPVVVSAPGFTIAEIHVGPWVGGTGTGGAPRKEGGVEVPCGNKDPWGAVVPARWEGLVVPPDAGKGKAVEFTVVDGWFDRVACRASSVRRTITAVKEIVPGLVYGFRACGMSCAESETLNLILPTARSIVTSRSDGAPRTVPAGFTRASLPLRRGGAESMMAYVSESLSQHALPGGKPGPQPRAFLVGVEVTQGIVDPDPVAVVFVQPAEPGDVQVLEGSLDLE